MKIRLQTDNVYDFCVVCRQSITDFKNHPFTKAHKTKLDKLFERMERKCNDARYFLQTLTPVEEFKQDNFWCDFCETEINEANSTFVAFATVKHLSSSKHKKRVHQFFMKHVREKRHRDKKFIFSLPPKTHEAMRGRIKKLLEQKEREKDRQLKEEVQLIEKQQKLLQLGIKIEDIHLFPFDKKILTSFNTKSDFSEKNSTKLHNIDSQENSTLHNVNSKEMKAVEHPRPVAYSDKLTFVPLKEPLKEGEGNVFTGATPPWLIDEPEPEKEFDPKAESNFLKEKFTLLVAKIERRLEEKKKNPNRVGADFVRKKQMGQVFDEKWLPNFGPVFHYGPRSEAKRNVKQ